tara:strand:- start:4231 stop:6135 length:1905 start_codon:yes stop_codon:yes gene_type:complete
MSSSVFTDFSSLDFDFSGSALQYRYEITHASGDFSGNTPISGLLGTDFSDSSSNSINFDSDSDVGGAATYDIAFYVEVGYAGGAAVDLETLDVLLSTGNSATTSLLDFSGATADFSGSAFNFAQSADISGSSIRFTGAVGASLYEDMSGSGGSFSPIESLTDSSGTFYSSTEYSGSDLSSGSSSTSGGHLLFTLRDVSLNSDISGTGLSTIQFTDDTDLYDTTFSRIGTEEDASGSTGSTLIKSLDELGFTDISGINSQGFYESDRFSAVTIHEAESNLVNVATNIYTQRYIGSSDKTNLIRANSYNLDSSGNQAIVAESYWINAGTFAEQLDDISISDVSGSVLKIVEDDFSSGIINDFSGSILNSGWDVSAYDPSGSYISKDGSGNAYEIDGLSVMNSDMSGGMLDSSTMDGAKLVTRLYLDSSGLSAGDVHGFGDASGIFQLTGEQSSTVTGYADAVTENLITYQGDLNYDGRVSLTDLAFLNAGEVAEDSTGNFADVDANFDGSITIADLAVLSNDWGGNIYDASGVDFSGNYASFDDFGTADSWVTLNDSSGSFINNALSELNDFSGSSIGYDSSGSTTFVADIFEGAEDFTYDNTSYSDGFADKDSYNSVGSSLGGTNYDTLNLLDLA